MDPHGVISDRRPSTFHHEQRLRRNDLVLPTCFSCHLQRYLRLRLWNYIRANATHQTIPQKDRGRFCWCLGTNYHLWRWHDECLNAVQIFHLPCKCMYLAHFLSVNVKLTRLGSRRKYLDRPPMHSKSRLYPAHIPPPNLVSICEDLLHVPDAASHSRLWHVRIPHRAVWWVLCLRSKAHLQDQRLR
jgi:hypothetical protein